MQEKQRMPVNAMAVSAAVCGCLSIISCWTVFGGLLFGGLAVCFALLSRGAYRMSGAALAGFICGMFGLGISLAAGVLLSGFLMSEAVYFVSGLPMGGISFIFGKGGILL